jgi:hypothetical protein
LTKRPQNYTCWLNEAPPLWVTLLSGLQHIGRARQHTAERCTQAFEVRAAPTLLDTLSR